MSPMVELREKDLNKLYAASLEFGSNWRRPVEVLAAERLSSRTAEYRTRLASAVEECRRSVEERVASRYFTNGGLLGRLDAREAHEWIHTRYPWITGRNRRSAIGQGQYYADHG